ncbi:MAG TPA: U32 family peptidase [Verrucomicrobiae bacterium]|nr:U32 family peptidase [Verrucomicrobiae bacterium]
MNTIPGKAELLAPAGSLEAFFAAMEKGADAVYAGLDLFSARAKAKNFTLRDMERIVPYADAAGRKVYITLNTLIKERELPLLVETLSALEEMGAHGIIIQDLAVWRVAREHFPGLPIHASTQMTIHNSLGVKQLEQMGFSRVVLARELGLDEIAEIRRTTKMELECFIHGALCFSFSGQCYFSSFLGGHSGNRGRCTQPCRRLYRYRGKEGYYLSTNDFSSIEVVHRLVEAGVVSLKIEGRMKSAEYVATVVEAYRKVLDASPAGREQAVGEAREILKLSFGRTPTKGFLTSRTPADIAMPHLKGATGRFLGEIRSASGGTLRFETKDRLHVGDRLRIQPKSDMAGKAFTIREIFLGTRKSMSAPAGSRVSIPCPLPCSVGDALFKVSSESAFTMSENACRKRLEAARRKLPLELELSLDGSTLKIAGRSGEASAAAAFELGELEESRTADMEGVLAAQFSKTGETPFTLRSLSVSGFAPLAIPPARLKEIRRAFYQAAEEEIQRELRRLRREKTARALAGLAVEMRPEAGTATVTVKVEHLRDGSAFPREQVDSLAVPVTVANIKSAQGLRRRGDRERIVWSLPFVIYEEDVRFYAEAVQFLLESGFRRFELSNLGHFPLLQGKEAEISTDYRLFSLNTQALLAWRELGASCAMLYIEDDHENLEELLAARLPLPRCVLVYAPVPLISSRIAIRGVREESPLVSDRGDAYRVSARRGMTTVTAARQLSLTQHRERLRRSGCSSFVLDLSGTRPECRKQVLEAFARGGEIPDTSSFNYATRLV